MNELLELAEQYKKFRETKSELEVRIKELNKNIAEVEALLIEDMLNNEVPSFKHEGSTYSLVTREYIRPDAERKQELWEKMKEQGFEHLFSINSQTLQATIKELKAENEDEMPNWLEELVKATEKNSIRLSKTR